MDARTAWASTEMLDPLIANRWASLGPYYAMFPVEFARKVIATYTSPGDVVLDPFCGRGTSIFCAGEAGREGFGIEINPVGWLYTKVKINPAPRKLVEIRLAEISQLAGDNKYLRSLPKFFRSCYCPEVLEFLVSARRYLNWKDRTVDATLMAFILVNLHGRIDANGRPQALSNQMRQTKSMSQAYSIRWWRDNGFQRPPKLDPVAFLKARMAWRYAKGFPTFPSSTVKLGDARTVLNRVSSDADRTFQLLLTSPPYSAVTSYYFDQWLRLWMLGDAAIPSRTGVSWKGRFENREAYQDLIEAAFMRSARLMARDSVIYVRTDAREFTLKVTIEALRKAFPKKKLRKHPRPFTGSTQTALFGDAKKKPGEVDLILN